MNKKRLEGLYSISHEVDVIINEIEDMDPEDFDKWKILLDRLNVQAGKLNALSTYLNATLRKYHEDGPNE